MMHRFSGFRTVAAALLALVAACGGPPDEGARTDASRELDGADVRLPAPVDATMTLVSGRSDDVARGRYVSRVAGVEAEADFDGDGLDERAVLLTASTGRGEVSVNLVAFGAGASGPEQEAVLRLAEGVRLHRFEALGDTLVLIVADASDAFYRSTRRLRIRGTRWVDAN